jgi:mRNA interferase RelE/StbE
MMAGYDLLIEPTAHQQRKWLPGNVRQRIKRAIDDLAQDPRPPNSQTLDTTDLGVPEQVEIRRIRLDKWRLVYAVNDEEQWVWVWGVRRRPPYDYEDLAELVKLI